MCKHTVWVGYKTSWCTVKYLYWVQSIRDLSMLHIRIDVHVQSQLMLRGGNIVERSPPRGKKRQTTIHAHIQTCFTWFNVDSTQIVCFCFISIDKSSRISPASWEFCVSGQRTQTFVFSHEASASGEAQGDVWSSLQVSEQLCSVFVPLSAFCSVWTTVTRQREAVWIRTLKAAGE